MKTRRPSAALLTLGAALITAVTLTGCTSSTKKPHPSAPASSTTQAVPGATGTKVAPAALAARLQKGLASATSAHLAVSTLISGQTIKGSGDATLANGAIDKADLQQQLPSSLGTIRIIVIGGTTYAKLPGSLTSTPTKPWVVLRSDSSSVIVSQLAGTVQPILAVASPASVVAFARSASAVFDLGPASAAGVSTTRYRVTVDAKKLPSSVPSSISAGGKSTIPVEMYLDAKGRPVQVTGTFSISGQTVTPTIVLTDYDEHVSVSSPPASQISIK